MAKSGSSDNGVKEALYHKLVCPKCGLRLGVERQFLMLQILPIEPGMRLGSKVYEDIMAPTMANIFCSDGCRITPMDLNLTPVERMVLDGWLEDLIN